MTLTGASRRGAGPTACERLHRRRRGVVPRLRRRPRSAPSTGTPCRRASSRRRACCSTCSIAPASRATFFVLGWVAERYPALVEDDPRGRARDRLARLSPPAGLRARPEAFVADLRRERRGAARRRRRRRPRFPRAGMVDQRAVAVGARTCCVEEGVHARREHGAAEDGRRRRIIRAIRTCRPTRGRADSRSAAARRRSIRAGDAASAGAGGCA